MPTINTASTSDVASRLARLSRIKKLSTGELKSELPVGTFSAIVKTASVYHNPATNKISYRADLEVVGGEYAGCTTLVFTSAQDDSRLAQLANAMGLNDDASLGMLLDQDPEILRAMQGKQVRFTRVAKPDNAKEMTNNWA